MHCHIAFHASEGLALQIMERQDEAFRIWNNTNSDPASVEARRVCGNWDEFRNDCTQHWPGNLTDWNCFPACNGFRNKTQADKYSCKNLLYDDSGI